MYGLSIASIGFIGFVIAGEPVMGYRVFAGTIMWWIAARQLMIFCLLFEEFSGLYTFKKIGNGILYKSRLGYFARLMQMDKKKAFVKAGGKLREENYLWELGLFFFTIIETCLLTIGAYSLYKALPSTAETLHQINPLMTALGLFVIVVTLVITRERKTS